MLEQVVTEVLTKTQHREDGEVNMDTRLEDIGVDSLRAITILYELEERFDIEIPNEVIEKISTVGDVVDCLRGILKNDGEVWQNE